MNMTAWQTGKINPKAEFFHVLLSGKEVWGTFDTLTEALKAAEDADRKYPKEIVWVADSDRHRDPSAALDSFSG